MRQRLNNLRGGHYPLPLPDDFDLTSPPSCDIDEDDNRPLPPPPPTQPLHFQPPQQLPVFTPREIEQMAAGATVGEK